MAKTPSSTRKEYLKELAVKYYLQGHSLRAAADMISEETGYTVSYMTVNRYVDKAKVEWKESKMQMISAHKEIELAKINLMESEAWGAWYQSKGGLETQTTKRKGANQKDGTLSILEKAKQTKKTFGDVRFLDIIKWCVEARCKLLGVEVPMDVVPTGTGDVVSSSTTTIRRVVFRTRKQIQEGRAAQEVEGSAETFKEAI